MDIPTKHQVAAAQLLGHIKETKARIETLRGLAKALDNGSVGAFQLRSGLLDAVDSLEHAENGIVAGFKIDGI